MMLRRICYRPERLPRSYIITDGLVRIGEYPIGCGGYSDVWRGVYQGSKVAIKVLRVNPGSDFANLEKVRPFVHALLTVQYRPMRTG